MNAKAIQDVLEGAAEHPNAGDEVREALETWAAIQKLARRTFLDGDLPDDAWELIQDIAEAAL